MFTNYFAAGALRSFLPDCFAVVRAFTGDLLFTARASFKTIWLRRRPVLRALVRFFGFPMCMFLSSATNVAAVYIFV